MPDIEVWHDPGVTTPTAQQTEAPSSFDRYFEITARGSTLGREIRGGLATFFTMAYIVVLNPIILSGADIHGHKLAFGSIAAVTALVAGVMTILMGAVGRYPFALATGLGINAVVAVYAATQMTWPEVARRYVTMYDDIEERPELRLAPVPQLVLAEVTALPEIVQPVRS